MGIISPYLMAMGVYSTVLGDCTCTCIHYELARLMITHKGGAGITHKGGAGMGASPLKLDGGGMGSRVEATGQDGTIEDWEEQELVWLLCALQCTRDS